MLYIIVIFIIIIDIPDPNEYDNIQFIPFKTTPDIYINHSLLHDDEENLKTVLVIKLYDIHNNTAYYYIIQQVSTCAAN